MKNIASYASNIVRQTLFVISVTVLSAGYFLIAAPKVGAVACASPSTDYGRATVTLNVGSAATYRVWTRLYVPDGSNNSFLFEIDGNTCFTAGDSGIPANTWTWVDYQGGVQSSKMQLNLSAGNHSLKMIGREPGVRLGRILFVSNLSCVPVGNGDNCASTPAPPDTEGPSIDITAPVNGANVSGVVGVKATARDNIAVAKVDFFVNGVLKSSDTSSPYAYDWDSRVTANGKVGLMAKAYDAAGNASSDSIQVNVAGGDGQAPTIPGNVSATADAANKVTVKWSASTDNVGVAGYRILRNKVTVGQANATDYVDGTVLPGTAYGYQVVAYDQAGNSSAPSGTADVKTPNVADSQPPAAPANVTATAVSPNQINLSWTASSDNIGIAAYDIFRMVAGGKNNAIKVATVTKTGYGDTGLTPKTKYSYYIVAKDAALNASNKSAAVTAETKARPEVTTGVLRGKVTFAKNAQGHGRVTIRIKGVKHVYDTDSQGRYEIIKLPQGSYKVSYEAEGSHTKEVMVKIQAGKINETNVTLIKR